MTAKKKSAKKKAKATRARKVLPLNIIDRFHDGRAWTYRDQDEACFLWWLWPEISLESIDNFIEGRQGIMLPDHMRAELLETRREALQAYRSGKHYLATALAGKLTETCRLFGQYFAAKPAVVGHQKYRKTQAEKAKLPRVKIGDGDETVASIIEELAARTDELGDQLSAADLWGEFFSELDSRSLHPEEHEDPNKDKARIEYDFKDRRRQIGFRTFENRLAMIRKSR